MNQARSGELSVELGRAPHHEGQAEREHGVSTERQRCGTTVTTRCHWSSLRQAMRQVPDPTAFGWPPDRGLYWEKTNRKTLRDRCPRVEPHHC